MLLKENIKPHQESHDMYISLEPSALGVMMQHSNLFQGIAIATHRGQPDGLADTVMLTPAGRASKPV